MARRVGCDKAMVRPSTRILVTCSPPVFVDSYAYIKAATVQSWPTDEDSLENSNLKASE